MGSSAVFVADYVSDSQNNFVDFQILCVIVAIISCVAMCYAGLNVKVDKKYEPVMDEKGDKKNGPTSVSWWSLTFQICITEEFRMMLTVRERGTLVNKDNIKRNKLIAILKQMFRDVVNSIHRIK
ncbi:uncharacterized protein LOC114535152 [Dendronephthya gigantea]|uniref:uncharacterized protein LOC114535152 n=1 Tax=Dendronephthya gigantea TaxID=151771 RepID=UPI00106ADD22|nr:uncharacterized protein LOC114535152 [Dendronephthya gigantea]